MKIIHKSYLALKYLIQHLKRYTFIIIAIGLGFSLITTLTSFTAGLSSSVRDSARNHYGGDLFISGNLFRKGMDTIQIITETEGIDQIVEQADLKAYKMIRRTNYFKEGILYFAGNSIRQKNIYGIDWQQETTGAQSLILPDVDMSNIDFDSESIILSKPTADKLKVRVGDDVIVQVNTLSGQKNTGTFIVKAIFNDKSIFGYYKCYMPRESLNLLLDAPKESYSFIGFYEKDKKSRQYDIDILNELFLKNSYSFQEIEIKSELHSALQKSWSGTKYLLLLLEVYVSEVSDLLNALNMVSYFLYSMIILIVVISIFITYRIIIQERTQEIATIRALGIFKRDIISIYFMEALMLFIFSIFIGFIFSLFLLKIISLFSFSWMPGIEIFLDNGKITPRIGISRIFINSVIILSSTIPAVILPLVRVINMNINENLGNE